jgi:ketosteroid isomerase-like protein
MTDEGKSAGRKTAALTARNKKLVLDYVDALRRRDRAAVEAMLSQNFRFVRLNDRLSRFEYLDSLERTIFSQNEPRLDVLFIAAEGDSVSIEILLEFDFEARRLQGHYNSIYVIEDGELYEMREYGGITEFPT